MTASPQMIRQRSLGEVELRRLQEVSFAYYWHEANEENGLILDHNDGPQICSVAAVGLALSLYPVAIERRFVERSAAVERTLKTLRFFANAKQSADEDATGFHGFYYHFLDLKTGRRTSESELSTIDSAVFLAGALTVAAYFQAEDQYEAEIRELASVLYRKADWRWALNGGAAVSHGWKPGIGFLDDRWTGYCEALVLYLLALGSPTFCVPVESYHAWTSGYRWRSVYGHEYLFAGPLFIHQLSHVWIDLRGVQDDFMRDHGIDYFENSRRATYVQQEYAIRNPKQFKTYGELMWGITASHGPDATTLTIDGIERTFLGYAARGVPDGPDDGTLAPFVVAASLPFAPEIVLPTLAHFTDIKLGSQDPYGFKATFNATYPGDGTHSLGWVSPHHYGINQGPIALMIENYRSGMIWRLMRGCQPLIEGLRRAGFRGGWID